ncbi:MAG: hypothetical protein JOY62_07295 [Acidobacteriaceae bacterium]|nr:hypothetical protein [Acidobacteriaceae bacterium]MBV9779763.1 hypothetical protein [Acidobacteriaceae bacterium]
MPLYRIHRIKEAARENFRWAPHTGGAAVVKPKDYDLGEEREAPTPYALWKALLTETRPLRPGDLLEMSHVDDTPGQLLITKYIGFEPASWYVPGPPSPGNAAAEVSAPAGIPPHC